MKRIISLTLAVVAGPLLGAHSAMALPTFFTDRSAWEGSVASFADVDETQWGGGYSAFPAGTAVNLPSTRQLTFDLDLEGRIVPDEWATWSGGNTPTVLYAFGGFDEFLNPLPTSLTASVSGGTLGAFGLELEPAPFADITMTLLLGTGEELTQIVNGDGGAMFFGWTEGEVLSFTISAGSDFAFGRMVEGTGFPTPGVPDGGSLGLVSGLVWAGLLGFGALRRKTT